MDMANLPAKTEKKSLTPEEERFREAAADLVIQGRSPSEIAKKLHPDDPAARKTLRSKLWRLVRNDADFHRRIGERAHAKLVLGLGPTVEGIVRRAEKGNPQAAKLVLEASGFHNPKMQHEHSGEVSIKLDLPRPPAIESTAEPVQDAEVVE